MFLDLCDAVASADASLGSAQGVVVIRAALRSKLVELGHGSLLFNCRPSLKSPLHMVSSVTHFTPYGILRAGRSVSPLEGGWGGGTLPLFESEE